MATPLLTTKFFIPPPGKNLVIRPRLLEKLNEGLFPECRLMLISAPAGFGKTTLVSSWVDRLKVSNRLLPLSVAWLSLDNGDNDPVSFWSYVVHSIQAHEDKIGKRALSLLQSQAPSNAGAIISLLVNELVEIQKDFILILDDFHLIRNSVIHQLFSSFIGHAPPKFHVVILSRIDPPLPLALLRGRGQLQELRLEDLRFSNDEAAAYLNDRMNLSLSGRDIATLNSKTEGWAAGLQIAGISLIGKANPSSFVQTFSGSNRHILDYLTDEILNQQPAEVQNFLLHTSILERLSAPLCEAVVDVTGNAQAMLEYLEKNNLFIIALDQDRLWYRYHHLFAEILHLKLTRKSPDMIPILQRRAAMWYEANGLIEEATSYLYAVKDDREVVRLIEQNALRMIKQGSVSSLQKSVRLLPEKLIRDHPWLCILLAWFYNSQSKVVEAESLLNRAEDLIRQTGSDESAGEMLGILYSLRAEILHTLGDYVGTIETAQKALRLLDPSNATSHGSTLYCLGRGYYAMGELDHAVQAWSEFLHLHQKAGIYNAYAPIIGMCCHILTIQGKLQEAHRQYEQAIIYMHSLDINCFFVSGNVYNGLGMLAYQKNDLEEAYEQVTEGLMQNQHWGNLNAIAVSLAYRVQVQTAQGNLDGAWSDTQELDRIEQMYTPYFDVKAIFLTARVLYQLARGDIPMAVRLVQDRGLCNDAPLSFQREQDHITLARVLVAQGKFSEAEHLLCRMEETARAGGRFGRLIAILNLRAICLYALGQDSQAMQLLQSSLDLAEPEGYIRVFIDLYEPMAQLLALALKRGIHPDYIRRLLNSSSRSTLQTATNLDTQEENLALIEPLSQREADVLCLMAMGLANKEIAQRLNITVRTVKYHATSIYTKLNVDRRREAIEKARELGFLH
jgi:LuxR family maltose regulon positive regulatory protein